MIDEQTQKWIQENYPFFTYIQYGKKNYTYYLGIVLNTDKIITTLYNYEDITTTEMRRKFVELGDQWWWESNRRIPINLFLAGQMTEFKPHLVNLNSKDVEICWGPETSIADIMEKRIKKRSIKLLRKLD